MTRQPELDVRPTRRVVLGRTALAAVAGGPYSRAEFQGERAGRRRP